MPVLSVMDSFLLAFSIILRKSALPFVNVVSVYCLLTVFRKEKKMSQTLKMLLAMSQTDKYPGSLACNCHYQKQRLQEGDFDTHGLFSDMYICVHINL